MGVTEGSKLWSCAVCEVWCAETLGLVTRTRENKLVLRLYGVRIKGGGVRGRPSVK